MQKAALRGDPSAMMLFGMAQLTGKGVQKNEIDGIRMIPPRRRGRLHARHAGPGSFLQGRLLRRRLQPEEAKRLIGEAAKRGDPAAQNILASLEDGSASETPEQ